MAFISADDIRFFQIEIGGPVKFLLWHLGFWTLFSIAPIAHAGSFPKTAACIQQVCSSVQAAPSAKEFIDREKTLHPSLDQYFAKFAARIEDVRLNRARLAALAGSRLSDQGTVANEIRAYSLTDLLIAYLDVHPWNLGLDVQDGKYIVVAVPLVSSDEKPQADLIKELFLAFKGVSPVFSAYASMMKLNSNPREALGVPSGVPVKDFVLAVLQRRLDKLSEDQRELFQKKIARLLAQIESFPVSDQERIVLSLGDIDLQLAFVLGEVSLSSEDRSLVEGILTKRFVSLPQERAQELSHLDRIYDSGKWNGFCRASYNRALHYALSESEKANIPALATDANKRAHRVILDTFGPALASQISAYMATMDINGPMTLAEYAKFTDGFLASEEELYSKAQLSTVELYTLLKDVRGEKDGIQDSICNNWVFSPTRDNVSGNSVNLSSYTTKNPSSGLSVIVHELGHSVSVALKFLSIKGVDISSFIPIRQCLSNNYLRSDRLPIYEQQFPPDKLWTEEDWADAFSGVGVKDLNVNEMCSFLGVLPDFDYVKLENRPGDNPHSPVFYRVLNIYAHSGKAFPQACKDALATEFDDIQFPSCLGNPAFARTQFRP